MSDLGLNWREPVRWELAWSRGLGLGRESGEWWGAEELTLCRGKDKSVLGSGFWQTWAQQGKRDRWEPQPTGKKRKYSVRCLRSSLEPLDSAHGNNIPSAAFHPRTGPFLCRESWGVKMLLKQYSAVASCSWFGSQNVVPGKWFEAPILKNSEGSEIPWWSSG